MNTLLITGAGRGLGLATTKLFLDNGDRVYACSRNLTALKELAKEFPDRCIPLKLDLESRESIDELAAIIFEAGHEIDYLIHNAGYLVNKPFKSISARDLMSCYQVNVIGPFLLTQQILDRLSPRAHVVAISSMGAFQGSVKFPGLTAYSSSKASAASLMECLQAEFSDYSQSFNCLCIGAVQTEMLENAFPGYRAPLQPEEMARFIYQFTTTGHRFSRGKVLPISLSTP